jgi:hypothetical protein
VLSPLAVLRLVEPSLQERTKGVLSTQVTSTAANDMIEHHLDLVAVRLGYRVTLLAARHGTDLVYPAVVKSRAFAPPQARQNIGGMLDALSGNALSRVVQAMATLNELAEDEREATSQDEFTTLVQQVLASAYVRSLIHSLIAKSNDSQGNGNLQDDQHP